MPNLCTLGAVKTYLGIADTSQDAQLTALIAAASQDFMNQTNRPDFAPPTDYVDYLVGNDSYKIFANHYPMNSVASLTVNGTTIPVWSSGTPDTLGYIFDDTLAMENRAYITLRGTSATFPRPCWPDYRGVILSYNAGYNPDSNVPSVVSEAICEWVAFKRIGAKLQSIDPATTSVTLGDYSQTAGRVLSETLAFLESGVPGTIQAVIDQYKRPQI
jgi:hypothetical protein